MSPFWAKGAGHRRLQAPAPVLQAPWCRNWSCSCPRLMEPAGLLARPSRTCSPPRESTKAQHCDKPPAELQDVPICPRHPLVASPKPARDQQDAQPPFPHATRPGNPPHCLDNRVAGAVGDTMEKFYFMCMHGRPHQKCRPLLMALDKDTLCSSQQTIPFWLKAASLSALFFLYHIHLPLNQTNTTWTYCKDEPLS